MYILRNYDQRIYERFMIPPNEIILSILGDEQCNNFLSGSKLKKVVFVLTDKFIYIRGRIPNSLGLYALNQSWTSLGTPQSYIDICEKISNTLLTPVKIYSNTGG